MSEIQKKHMHENLLLRNVPEGPWLEVGADIFYFKQIPYILLVDYYSKFVELKELRIQTTDYLIKALKSNFARYGIPRVLYTDNGPQFNNFKFKTFAQLWNFSHVTSSPYYPRSNGMAERYIQTFKIMLKKAEYSKTDPYLAILEYRNTPISPEINKSPSQLMFGHNVNAFLPTQESFILNRTEETEREEIKGKLNERQNKYKMYHDRKYHTQPQTFVKDEIVFVKDSHNNMTPAVITGESEFRPRSYKLTTESGNVTERNRYNIYKAPQNYRFDAERDIDYNLDTNNDKNTDLTNANAFKTCPDKLNSKQPEIKASTMNSENVTRSGRAVKKPQYLTDYVK